MRIVIIDIILCISRKSRTKYGAKYITRKHEKRNICKEEKEKKKIENKNISMIGISKNDIAKS